MDKKALIAVVVAAAGFAAPAHCAEVEVPALPPSELAATRTSLPDPPALGAYIPPGYVGHERMIAVEPAAAPAAATLEAPLAAPARAEARRIPIHTTHDDERWNHTAVIGYSPEMIARLREGLTGMIRDGSLGRWYDGERPAREPEAAPAEPVEKSTLPPPNRRTSLDLASFWRAGAAHTVATSDGKRYPLTYSFDSEIDYDDILRAAETLPEFNENVAATYPVEDLARALKRSPAQLRAFGLRRGVDRAKAAYGLADLHRGTASRLLHARVELRDHWHRIFESLVGLALRRARIPAAPHGSDEPMEVAHASWTQTPRSFEALIRKLHAFFRAPQSHLHVGLPAAMGRDAALAAARAVELKMILSLASSDPTTLPEQDYNGSTLVPSAQVMAHGAWGSRGLVKLGFGVWTQPHESHDLEIRYYEDLDEGLGYLAFAGRLAQAHRRLKTFPDFGVDLVFDELTNHLQGALRYAALLFESSPRPGDAELVPALTGFADRIAVATEGNQRIPMALRWEIRDFLVAHGVEARLTPELFLK